MLTRALALALAAALALGIAGAAERTPVFHGPEKSALHAKVDSTLNQLLELARSGGVSAQAASRSGVPVAGNAVRVVVETSGPVAQVAAVVGRLLGGGSAPSRATSSS